MDSIDLLRLTLETLEQEQRGLRHAEHPHIVAAHKAAIADLNKRIEEIRGSTRLSDKVRIVI